MTAQGLTEKLARAICCFAKENENCSVCEATDTRHPVPDCYPDIAIEVNNIINFYKQAGWDDCEKWYKANGYVKLNERDKPLILIEEYKVEFPMCGHPELIPIWGQEKPESTRTIGQCPLHNYVCPVCGFGVGCSPACGCSEMRY